MRRFITASDVELVYLTGQRIIYVDDDDVVSGVAREMATKLGVNIIEGQPPQDHGQVSSAPLPSQPSKQPVPSPLPTSKQIDNSEKKSSEVSASEPWIPSEFQQSPDRTEIKDVTESDIILKNGNVVWPGQGIFLANIHISQGKIASLDLSSRETGSEGVDVSGKYILPGIIDPHVHMGIFTPFERDIRDETKAGLWGGITTLGCFLYEKDSYIPKLEEVYKKVMDYSYADVFFHLTISTEEQLDEIPRYVNEFGIRSFKIYMCGVVGIIPDIDDSFLRRVYEKLEDLDKDITVGIHAENASLVGWATEAIAAKNGKKTSVQEWSETHPAMAEEEAIRRAVFLTKEFKSVSTYFVHISTKGGIEVVSKIKGDGGNVYAETTSPYLLFHIEGVEGNLPKWLPPLRNKDSVEALWHALEIGRIDSIGTDSVPMSQEIKGLDKTVWEAMPNAPSLEFHLPGILTEGVVSRGIKMPNLVDLMTRRPAEIFGVFPRKGTLWPGADADLVVVDTEKWKRVSKDQIRSGTPFSLFEGQNLTGWPDIIIKAGKMVVKDGNWIADPPPSKVLNKVKT